MTAPVNLSVQYSGTTLRIIFDRAISVTGGSELNGFTFTDGSGAVTPTFSSVDQNALIATLPGAVTGTLDVDYDQTTGTVVEAVAPNDPVADFAATAVETYSQPLVRRAEAGLNGNDTVTIFFSEPVASPSGDELLGLTIEVNDLALDLSSAVVSYNDDQTQLTVDTGVNIAYNDVVDVIYDDSTGDLYTWPNGAVASFTLNDVTNVSTDGLPDSQYPLSHVIALAVSVESNIATATLQVSLNPIDIQLVNRYGPVTVLTGGTYGQTVSNPAGLSILGAEETIVDGAELTQDFYSAVNVLYAVDAAKDWLTIITNKIGIALGEVRADDQSLTLGDRTVSAV